MFTVRKMHARDIAHVLAIQHESYSPDILETEAVIRARLSEAGEHALVAEDADGVCGYLFAYQSRVGKVTPLDGAFQPHPQADCLYLHDLAVARRAGGRGIGPALVQHNLGQAKARRMRYSALVSVQDSHGFWSRLGYRRHDELEQPQAKNLASYRIPAVYMVRALHD